ncbi:MAG: Lrp/AsnC family transcriptional regulator [Pseudomonadota bacterium]
MKFSGTEKTILREVQRDSSLSLGEISNRTGIAQSTLWRKLNDLEKSGVIRGRVALLDPGKVGCKLTVLAFISLTDHSEDTVAGFAHLIEGHPEIVECFATSGQADYHLKMRVADVEAYERFMTQTLLRSPFVRELHSSFVLKELKSTTELPL